MTKTREPIQRFLICLGAGLIFCAAYTGDAAASAFNDLLAAAKQAFDHNRSADFYLRTGNYGVAAVELEAMQSIWESIRKQFATTPPDPFANDPAWSNALTAIADQTAEALALSRNGKTRSARTLLGRSREVFATLRQRNRIVIFADCVAELNGAMAALWHYRRNPPDFTSIEQVDAVKARAAVLDYMLRKCRDRALKPYREDDMFQRLFRESLEAMGRLAKALATKNRRLLIDTLRELRSFDRMIFLRYG